MKNFMSPNIGNAGRLMRGLMALALAAAGILATPLPWWARTLLFISAGFVAFEALRGWCVLRACGIKTKL